VLASQPSTSANCSLVFSFQWGLNYEQVEDMGLLAVVVLVIELAGVFSQLGLLSAGTILGLETGKTIQPG